VIHANDRLYLIICSFLYISKHHPNQIWTGGDTEIASPYLAKSMDGGDSWTILNREIEFSTDAVVRDVVVHPDDPERVLAGLTGPVTPANVIRKSSDGGESWETVLEEIGAITLENSLIHPGRVYASGRHPTGNLFVAVSEDFGNSWMFLKHEEGPSFVTINDMAVIVDEGQDVLFFATDKGLFSFRFE
jgi:hypothetical protein